MHLLRLSHTRMQNMRHPCDAQCISNHVHTPHSSSPMFPCVQGAEDAINKPFAFEISTQNDSMYFIAESEKEKEDWINSVGRAIVKHSRSLLENDRGDYTTS